MLRQDNLPQGRKEAKIRKGWREERGIHPLPFSPDLNPVFSLRSFAPLPLCGKTSPRDGAGRRGFTLVEMLVTISIIVIVLVMTVAAVNVTVSSDRLPSAARLVQSHLEGARNRAIYATQTGTSFPARGVRFLLDPNGPTGSAGNPVTATSMVFIEAAGALSTETLSTTPITGRPSMIWIGRIINNPMTGLPMLDPNDQQTVNFGPCLLDPASSPPYPSQETQAIADEWSNLTNRGLLLNGARIWITPNPNNDVRMLTPDYVQKRGDPYYTLEVGGAGSGWRLTTPATSSKVGTNCAYAIELAPAISPNQDPQLLPAGVVIDLNHSQVPSNWKTPAGAFYNRLDIMFGPTGPVTNAPTGIIHLALAEATDVTNGIPPGWTIQPGNPQIVRQGDERIVTVFTRTGRIAVSSVLREDANNNGTLDPGEDINGNGVLDQYNDANGNGRIEWQSGETDGDIFYYAEQGREAK